MVQVGRSPLRFEGEHRLFKIFPTKDKPVVAQACNVPEMELWVILVVAKILAICLRVFAGTP